MSGLAMMILSLLIVGLLEQEDAALIAKIPGVLAQAAAEAVVPQQIDPTTTLVRVEADGMKLVYHYDSQELGVTRERLAHFFTTRNLPGICAERDMIFTMRLGVTFRYEWTTPDRSTPWVIEITEDDCAAYQ